jgi:hypothetical protein
MVVLLLVGILKVGKRLVNYNKKIKIIIHFMSCAGEVFFETSDEFWQGNCLFVLSPENG